MYMASHTGLEHQVRHRLRWLMFYFIVYFHLLCFCQSHICIKCTVVVSIPVVLSSVLTIL